MHACTHVGMSLVSLPHPTLLPGSIKTATGVPGTPVPLKDHTRHIPRNRHNANEERDGNQIGPARPAVHHRTHPSGIGSFVLFWHSARFPGRGNGRNPFPLRRSQPRKSIHFSVTRLFFNNNNNNKIRTLRWMQTLIRMIMIGMITATATASTWINTSIRNLEEERKELAY